MSKITIIGGTGYAGGNIVAAAARHGHTVRAFSRSAPSQPVEGVNYVQGSVWDDAVLEDAFDGADVVITALSPRGELSGRMLEAVKNMESLSAKTGVRLGVVGGAGSLFVAPGGPRVSETDGFPDEYKPEAIKMQAVLDMLDGNDVTSDWFYVSPPMGFGNFAPGELTGTWRVGEDVALAADEGMATISGPDFGEVFVKEIENPTHHQQRFTVAY